MTHRLYSVADIQWYSFEFSIQRNFENFWQQASKVSYRLRLATSCHMYTCSDDRVFEDLSTASLYNGCPRNTEPFSILLTSSSKLIRLAFHPLQQSIFHISLERILFQYRMISDAGSTQLSKPPSDPRFTRTSKMIKNVKYKLDQKTIVTVQSLAKGYGISKSSSLRILRDGLKLYAYKMTRCVTCFQMKKCLISTL